MKRKSALGLIVATPIAWMLGMIVSKLNIPVAHATSAPAAFTASYVTTTHNSANVELQRAEAVFAQRSDGSSVLLQKTAGPGVPSGTRRILDVQKKRVVSVDPRTESISTFHYSDDELDHARNPPLSCEQHGKPLAQDHQPQMKMEGLDVVRFSGKMSSTENPVVRWMAPALNCFVLQEEGTIVADQFRFRRTTASLSIGEPDPLLFEVPDSYTERSPSEVLALARVQMGLPETRNASHTYRSLDSIYKSRQEPK